MEKDNSSSFFKNNQRVFGPFVLSLEMIRPHLLNPHLNDTEIVQLVKEISIKFTQKRDSIQDYVLSENLVSAYTAFYLPTNIPKLHFLLSKLSDDVLADLANRPFIDVGAGPGTFSLAYKLLMGSEMKNELIVVDSSELMLRQTSKIFQGFFPKDNIFLTRKYVEKNEKSILFFGHSINEMGIQNALDHIMTINPEYIIWIEPGTSEFFHELKKLRTFIVDSYDVLYPCPTMEACPSSWCHQVLRTTHDESIERISQLVSLDRKTLPLSAHIYRKKKPNKTEENSPVIIRYLSETKFSFEYEICLAKEGMNKNIEVEIQKKNLSKKTGKELKKLSVGERVSFDIEKILEKKLRIKLK